MAERGTPIHVLLVAFSAQGHMQPMLRFGKRILSKGLRVTFTTTDDARELILESNKQTTDIKFEFFSDGWDLESERLKNMDLYMDKLRQAGPKNFATVLKAQAEKGHPVSCIVNNPFVPWVVEVAWEHKIPCAMLWIQPCALYALYYRYYLALNQFPDPTDPGVVLDLPGLPKLRKEDLPTFLFPENPFKTFPEMLSEQFGNIKKVNWVLANSFHELEWKAIESMEDVQAVKAVGPLVPRVLLGEAGAGDGAGAEQEEPSIEWLNGKSPRSVVYVAFGSILVFSSKQMENLAWGLRDSGRPFVWVVRPAEIGLGSGSGELPAGFLEEIKGQGLVVDWCPQVKVLSHPSVGCFLTHCGWNSTLETVAAGVPVIAFPQWTDQPTNAKLLVDVFGMGLRLRGDEGEEGLVRKEEVERCVGEIMEGERSEELKMKAVEWKVAAGKATMEGGSSDRNIQWFVDELVGLYKV